MSKNYNWQDLYQAAQLAASKAYAPYSRLQVGAAGMTRKGNLIKGCNVENASYGLTLCAECGLVSDMHIRNNQEAGEDDLDMLTAVAVVDGGGNPLTPCGRCRQLLLEAGGEELLVNEQRLGELLPGAFKPDDLPSSGKDSSG